MSNEKFVVMSDDTSSNVNVPDLSKTDEDEINAIIQNAIKETAKKQRA